MLTQAQGVLKRDQALLAEARLDLQRYRTLAAQNSIATQMVDTQAALVTQDEGTVETDQGQVAAAAVNLNWCRITSPITGRTGVRLVDPGNIVSPSGAVGNTANTASPTATSANATATAGIVVVNQIQPMAVTFTVPEGDFQRLSDASNGFTTSLTAKAYSQETNALLDTGEVTIADNRVDPTTGTVELKGRFPNADRHLWPGQFVNVQLTLQTLNGVTTIPLAAINRGPQGNFVYVVDANNKATIRPVTLTLTQDTTAVIKTGVSAGDTVVTDGQMTLKANSLVQIKQAAASPPAP